jgi:hypothetical protein
VAKRIENYVEHKDLALGAFLDTEGAFDRTSHDRKQAVERHDTEPVICRWICAKLESRNTVATVATLAGDTMRATVARECLQGGVLLPLLWSRIIEKQS